MKSAELPDELTSRFPPQQTRHLQRHAVDALIPCRSLLLIASCLIPSLRPSISGSKLQLHRHALAERVDAHWRHASFGRRRRSCICTLAGAASALSEVFPGTEWRLGGYFLERWTGWVGLSCERSSTRQEG